MPLAEIRKETERRMVVSIDALKAELKQEEEARHREQGRYGDEVRRAEREWEDKVRRLERELIRGYESLIEEILPALNAGNHAIAVELAALPTDRLVTEEVVRQAAGATETLTVELPASDKPYILLTFCFSRNCMP